MVFSFVWTTSSPYLFTVCPFTIHITHWHTYENNNIKRPQFHQWIFHALPFEPRHANTLTQPYIYIHSETHSCHIHFNSNDVRCSVRCYAPRTLSLLLRFEHFCLEFRPARKKKRKLCSQHIPYNKLISVGFVQYIATKTYHTMVTPKHHYIVIQ